MKFYLAKRADGPPKILTRKDEALKIDSTAEQIDIPTDQEGLRCAMQDFFNRVYDLEQAILEQAIPEEGLHLDPAPLDSRNYPAEPKQEGYAEKANRFEDEFDAMPLSLQLHYATRAMENARDKL